VSISAPNCSLCKGNNGPVRINIHFWRRQRASDALAERDAWWTATLSIANTTKGNAFRNSVHLSSYPCFIPPAHLISIGAGSEGYILWSSSMRSFLNSPLNSCPRMSKYPRIPSAHLIFIGAGSEGYKLWSSSLRNFLNSPLNSCPRMSKYPRPLFVNVSRPGSSVSTVHRLHN